MIYISDLGFYLNGQMYPNNSIVTITNIGVGDNALFCLSDNGRCCRNSNGVGSGEWFLPGGSSPILHQVGNLPQLLTSVEVEDPVQFS